MSNKSRPQNKSAAEAAFAEIFLGISGDERQQGASLTRPIKKSYRLEELLNRCKLTQLHGETDFGADVGGEVIE